MERWANVSASALLARIGRDVGWVIGAVLIVGAIRGWLTYDVITTAGLVAVVSIVGWGLVRFFEWRSRFWTGPNTAHTLPEAVHEMVEKRTA